MWFTFYFLNRSSIDSVGKEFSSHGKLTCSVAQGSILGPLLFLLYIHDMAQALRSELLLYATCLFFMGKDSKTDERPVSTHFVNGSLITS